MRRCDGKLLAFAPRQALSSPTQLLQWSFHCRVASSFSPAPLALWAATTVERALFSSAWLCRAVLGFNLTITVRPAPHGY